MKILEDVKNASEGSNMGIRLGSALLQKGRIIKTGCNRNDRSQWGKITFPGIHAEVSVTHSISPHSRPKTYRRLWSNGAAKEGGVSSNQGQLKGSFEGKDL